MTEHGRAGVRLLAHQRIEGHERIEGHDGSGVGLRLEVIGLRRDQQQLGVCDGFFVDA